MAPDDPRAAHEVERLDGLAARHAAAVAALEAAGAELAPFERELDLAEALGDAAAARAAAAAGLPIAERGRRLRADTDRLAAELVDQARRVARLYGDGRPLPPYPDGRPRTLADVREIVARMG